MGDIGQQWAAALNPNIKRAHPQYRLKTWKAPYEYSSVLAYERIAVKDFAIIHAPSRADSLAQLSERADTGTPLPTFPDPVEDALRYGDCFARTDKGKSPATSSTESAVVTPSVLGSVHQQTSSAPRVPAIIPAIPFGGRALPQYPSSKTRRERGRLASKPATTDEEHNDYPHIDGPRSSSCWEMVPYVPPRDLPSPTNMEDHEPITSYAGEHLYRLCPSVPYILGPLALIRHLQLIVEMPVLLPSEVIDLVTSRGIDVSTLSSYDQALLNILGCLWND